MFGREKIQNGTAWEFFNSHFPTVAHQLFQMEVLNQKILVLVKCRVLASQSALCLSWMNTLFTLRIRDWLQISASVIQSEDYSGNAMIQASVSLTLATGYFDQPFSFKISKQITKVEMILFSIHLPSKWTSAEGRGSPLYPVSLKNKLPLPWEKAQQAPLTGLSPAWHWWRGWLKRKA